MTAIILRWCMWKTQSTSH